MRPQSMASEMLASMALRWCIGTAWTLSKTQMGGGMQWFETVACCPGGRCSNLRQLGIRTVLEPVVLHAILKVCLHSPDDRLQQPSQAKGGCFQVMYNIYVLYIYLPVLYKNTIRKIYEICAAKFIHVLISMYMAAHKKFLEYNTNT